MKQENNVNYSDMYKPLALSLMRRVMPDIFRNKDHEQEKLDKEISDKLEALGLGE